MTDTNNANDWVVRISSATPAELVVINFEMLIDALDAAIDAPEGETFGTEMGRAKSLLDELILSLDHEAEISQELAPIYLYVNGLLMTAVRKSNTEPLPEARRILAELLNAWKQIAEEDKKANPAAAIESAGKIYSGLMYDAQGRPIETEIGGTGRTFEG